MVGEAQFTRWREDIANNLSKAIEAANVSGPEGKMPPSARMELAMHANEITASIMLSERLGHLSLALNRNDEVISQLFDERMALKGAGERVLEALSAMDNREDLPPELNGVLLDLENTLHNQVSQDHAEPSMATEQEVGEPS